MTGLCKPFLDQFFFIISHEPTSPDGRPYILMRRGYLNIPRFHFDSGTGHRLKPGSLLSFCWLHIPTASFFFFIFNDDHHVDVAFRPGMAPGLRAEQINGQRMERVSQSFRYFVDVWILCHR